MFKQLETLTSKTKPMQTFEGIDMPQLGIFEGKLHHNFIAAFIGEAEQQEKYLRRDTGRKVHHSFTIGQRSYCLSVEITWAHFKQVMFTYASLNPCDYLTASDLWEGAL